MAGKSILGTGGTGGIGKTTAIGLAALGAGVGITGRDPPPTEAAAASIRAAPAVTSPRSASAAMVSPAGSRGGAPAGAQLTGLSPTA
jgi:NAD(P)-dependent dehydrogenase (short-subunit alcohol dehydrogenase family)